MAGHLERLFARHAELRLRCAGGEVLVSAGVEAWVQPHEEARVGGLGRMPHAPRAHGVDADEPHALRSGPSGQVHSVAGAAQHDVARGEPRPEGSRQLPSGEGLGSSSQCCQVCQQGS